MIGSVRGTLIERDPRGVVIVEAGGVGYELNVTGSTASVLGSVGDEVFLRVYTRVREDAITLYGFQTGEEKRCFDALISAHGVGPSMGLALLSMHSPTALRQIVAMDDADALSQVPGIGKKTATRLLMELKAKFDVDLDDELIDITSPGGASEVSSARGDVITALTGLGYTGDEIRKVLNALPSDGESATLLRLALKELAASA
jgi:Holliday junction DNA helicase RuvA